MHPRAGSKNCHIINKMKECSATCPESNGYPVDFMRLIFGTVKLGLGSVFKGQKVLLRVAVWLCCGRIPYIDFLMVRPQATASRLRLIRLKSLCPFLFHPDRRENPENIN